MNYEKYAEIEAFVTANTSIEQKQRLEDVIRLLRGFESTFALELLATVDYVSSKNSNNDIESVHLAIASWSNRKSNLFEKKQIEIAHSHLKNYSENIFN